MAAGCVEHGCHRDATIHVSVGPGFDHWVYTGVSYCCVQHMLADLASDSGQDNLADAVQRQREKTA